jgi:hypothetical protein
LPSTIGKHIQADALVAVEVKRCLVSSVNAPEPRERIGERVDLKSTCARCHEKRERQQPYDMAESMGLV